MCASAVSSAAVFHFTVTVLALAADSVTVNVALAPSVADAAATDSTGGASSSVIVPTAVRPVACSVALVGSDSTTLNVSAGSSALSWAVCTSKVALVAPALIVTVSLVVTAV